MIERQPAEILTERHLIVGFDLVIDKSIGKVTLVRGNTVVDITHAKPKDIDFVILAPYRIVKG